MHSQELGDYIGGESCIDFSPDVPDIISRGGAGMTRPRRSRRRDAAAEELPPPIPLLVMKRHRTSDGRLVITEERAQRRQPFEVHRRDGRLVLKLIPVDVEKEEEEGGEEEKLGSVSNVADSGDEISGGNLLPEEVYIGVKQCDGFGMATPGFMPPVLT